MANKGRNKKEKEKNFKNTKLWKKKDRQWRRNNERNSKDYKTERRRKIEKK